MRRQVGRAVPRGCRRGIGGRNGVDVLHLGDQSIAALRYRLDIGRVGGIVAERLSQLGDRLIQGLIADDLSVPDAGDDLLGSDHIARPVGEKEEQIHMAWLKANLLAIAPQCVQRRKQPPWSDSTFLKSLAQLHASISNQLFR